MRDKKKRKVLMSVDGEAVDFSGGSKPDLRKQKKSSNGNENADLSLTDSNHPGTHRNLLSEEETRRDREERARRARIA